MATENPSAKEGRVWIQIDELSPFVLVSCHGLNSLTDPRGGLTYVREQDPRNRRGSVIVDTYEGERPGTTFNIVTKQQRNYNWLIGIQCAFNVQLHQGSCADPRIYSASPYGWSMRQARRETVTITPLAVYDNAGEDSPVGMECPCAAESTPMLTDWQIAFARVQPGTLTIATGINGIAILPRSCGGACGQKTDIDDIIWICGDVGTGSPAGAAEVWYTEDGGSTFTGTAADPFTALENVSDVVVYGTPSSYRVIVARGTEDVWNPAEIAYSDDKGATWTNVNVGSTNGTYINRLFSVGARIWAAGGAAGAGKLWYSGDGGASWTQVTTSAQLLNDVAIDYRNNKGIAVGASNVVLLSKDASASGSWIAATGATGGTGDAAQACAIKSTGTVFYGNSAGEVYASQNWGTTWSTESLQGATVTSVKRIVFYEDDDQFGMAIGTIAGPSGRVFRTTDGGATWQYVTALNANITANVGLNSCAFADNNIMYVMGEAVTSIGYVAKTSTSINATPS